MPVIEFWYTCSIIQHARSCVINSSIFICSIENGQDAVMQRKVSSGKITRAERAYIRLKTNFVRFVNFPHTQPVPCWPPCFPGFAGFNHGYFINQRLGLCIAMAAIQSTLATFLFPKSDALNFAYAFFLSRLNSMQNRCPASPDSSPLSYPWCALSLSSAPRPEWECGG